MKKLLFFLCLLAHTGFSQSNRIDSLKRELVRLDKHPEGYALNTLRYQRLKAIMRAYSDINVDSSVHYNSLLINLCKESKLPKELVYAYQYAGYLYQIKGDHHQSIQFHYKALPLAEELKIYPRIATSFGALAHAYTSLKEYTRAIKLCQQGLAILGRHPDAAIQLSILNVLGVIYREQGQLTNALNVNQAMYSLAQTEHNLWYEAHGLHAIGLVYKDMGVLTKALNYHKKALVLAHKTGSVELEGNILLNTTDLYTRQHQWKQALTYCMQAKQMATQVKNSSIVAEAYEKLYRIFKQTNQPDKALKAYESFVFLKDSLSKEKNQQRIETLRALYDNVQKTSALLAQKNQNQQLSLGIVATLLLAILLFWNNRRLQTKNVEINQQRALLESARKQLADINKTLETRVEDRTKDLVRANRELIQKNEEIKEALFKGQTIERKRVALELHDNLSSLLSAVNMTIQAINPQNLSVPDQSVYRNVRQLIQNAYAEVRNISHNILPAELEREGLATTLTTLIGQLNESSPLQFSLTITGLQERLPVEIEFNVYSIVFELINNAIKHARATTVGISLFRTDMGINLSVMDDGIGMGQKPTKPGVGLQNIQARLESLGGTLTRVLSAEKGTRIVIQIPIETVRFNGDFHTT